MTATPTHTPAPTPTRSGDAARHFEETAAANRAALAEALGALRLAPDRPRRRGKAAPDAASAPVVPSSPTAAADVLAAYRDLAPQVGRTAPAEVPAEVRDARDPLIALLRHQGIRWRQITLPDDGSGHGDTTGLTGPVIGFTAGEGRPVALPYARRARGSGGRAVDRRAYLLYRPLPAGTPTAGALLRFALAAPGARRDLLVLAGAGLAAALLALAVPLSTGLLMPRLVAAGHHPLRWLAVLLTAGTVAAGLLLLVRNVTAVRLTGRVQAALEPAVWDRLLDHDARFFRDFSTGDLVHRANAIAEARQALSEVLVGAVLGAFFSLSGLLVLLAVDPVLGAALLAAALVAVAALVAMGRRRQRYESRVHALHGRLHGTLYGLMLGIDKLQTAGREIQAFARWAVPFGEQKRADAAAMRTDAAATALTAALQPLLLAVLLAGVAARGTGAGGTGAGHLMAAGIAAGQVALALGQVTHAAATAYGIAPVLDRLRPVLAEPAEASGRRRGRADPGRLRGAVRLEEVSFRYPGAAASALEGVSLYADPGEMVAVVGPSGAGKSTLVRLLLGFERPAAGRVRYDGRDLAGLDPRLVRRQLGTVLQNGRLLRGSLLENLAGTDPDVTEDDVWRAAELAGIAADLRRLPLGLSTRVGEDAQGFSGGQVQRLLLARALVRRPAVLLLDEATSALDNATQRQVAEGIAALDRTRLVIAHRLSTIRRADRIYVLDRGRVSAVGGYDELLGSDPLFTRLVRPQEL
ncbi:ATP-binding cassette domain-containing protein [Streptomyces sp. HPF1205]|uniref:ATP-binding cassette domain-containing protein n=1 Tax=Streptomyces sp. HPF1205 TaxID=2873262 RepID=UPI001CED079B|nr:ATP-binding cassette domain-containing protein [Streptomyces sp. HPF1205]